MKIIMEGNCFWPTLTYCPKNYLDGLREIMTHLSQDNRLPGRDSNPGPPEHEATL
jgi:hypothetical protein